MTSILCLAHFCEVHGPTPLMVTEGLPVRCQACDDHDQPVPKAAGPATRNSRGATAPALHSAASTASQTAATAAVADAIRKMNLAHPQPRPSRRPGYDSAALDRPTTASTAASDAQTRQPRNTGRSSPPLPLVHDTPPFDSGSHFRKTYDESVTKRAMPCHNCAMTLPREQSMARAGSGANSPDPSRNPTLRTRIPCARVYEEAPEDASPLFLQPSSLSASSFTSSDSDDDERMSATAFGRYHHQRTGTMASASTSRSSTSSATSRVTNSHTHYLEYTSTHEPTGANAYYIIRASCLRTLTLESIPRPGAAAASVNPGASPGGGMLFTSRQPPFASMPPHLSPFHHSTASAAAAAAAAANGGPLFFGDSSAGYTTAHVFRVADVHARGHKRVYALIALTTHRERMAMKAFGLVSAAFNELAAWIQQLADAEADRIAMQSESTTASSSGPGSPATNTDVNGYSVGGSPQVSPPVTQPSSYVNDNGDGGSSFLAAAGHGLSRRMGPGYAGMSGLGSSSMAALRARGLPEILGKPDFFVELHTRFVKILLELGTTLNN